ncbi:hypothetical protein NIES4075_09500 [Tolypothrix sp. NIES-4075]|uniref:hypothetical protein n=1 Tax=Tolypothrix sp. NIES-4075 TaxID=2005459 RepID=UPI000B5C366F|nr:hypothetical protein [Tolypothrix sp. NIES-4075]GAX39988.1 hypothetical protein NIES4075_09500 [Tolypothrix sp. NIES-4075]
MECKLMLQSAFDWAKKGALSGGEFPKIAKVFATVTMHYSSDRSPEKTSNYVLYANGPLELNTKDGQEILSGNISMWVNKVVQHSIPSTNPPEDGSIDIGTTVTDIFPNKPDLKLQLSISQSGSISVARLIHGKLLGGFPPVTFQAVCNENELMTAIVDSYGSASCTLSLTLGSH